MSRARVVVASAAVALLLALGGAAPASAHTSLIGVDPEDGATVTAGDAVTLTFSEDLLTIGAEASLTDSSGAVTALEVTFPTAASARVGLPSMAAGAVSLAWRIVANDGHPIEGVLAFTAEEADAEPPTPSAVATATPGATPSQTADATPSATPDSSSTPPGEAGDADGEDVRIPFALWIALLAAVFASGVAIIASKRRQ